MNQADVVMKEYEIANDRYKFYSEAKTKLFGVFLTFFVVFLTFLVKGDLPQPVYLLLAAILFVFMLFQNYLTHKHVTAWLLWHYIEHKANSLLRAQGTSDKLLDLGEKTLYLVSGKGRYTTANRMTRHFTTIAVLAVYEFCIWQGSRAVSQTIVTVIAIHAAFYAAALTFAMTAFLQNRTRKRRYEDLISTLGAGERHRNLSEQVQ